MSAFAKEKAFIFINTFALFLIFSLFSPNPIFPQTKEERYKTALKLYSQKEYLKSKEEFESLIQDFPDDQKYSIFRLMVAKCTYNLKDYPQAEKDFKDFLTEFPESRFVGVAHFYLGNIYLLKKDNLSSAKEFIYAYENGDEKTKDLAFKSLAPLLEKGLDKKKLEELSGQKYSSELLSETFFFWGKRELEDKNFFQAKKIFENYLVNYPKSSHSEEVVKLLKQMQAKPVLKIGVLAPLTGEYSEYGSNMVNGIKMGLDADKVKLIIEDTQSDPKVAAKNTEDLIQKEGVSAILGPLTSEAFVEAAKVANSLGIPIISPTASQVPQNAGLGAYSFQFLPTPKRIGEGLATFAFTDLGLKEFALLSPDDSYGREVSVAFTNRIRDLGGKVLSSDFYPRGTTDFGLYLEKVREILLTRLVKIDSTKYVDEEGNPLPEEEIPLYLDGLFVPAYSEEAILFFPQIAFHKIKTKIFGTQGWGEAKILDLASDSDYVKRIFFYSEFLPQKEDSNWIGFKNEYESKYQKTPDKVAGLSYDATRLLVSSLDENSTPAMIRDKLANTKDFKGLFLPLSFDEDRGNFFVPTYTFEKGGFKRLK
jgi:branched-chain amino acid transport system substrate-binding protein